MGFRTKIQATVIREPEMASGVKNNREWKKYEVVCECESGGVSHPLHFIAWNRTAEKMDGMLLKKGVTLIFDILIKSEQFNGWWKTHLVIEDVEFVREERDNDEKLDIENIMFVNTEEEEELPF